MIRIGVLYSSRSPLEEASGGAASFDQSIFSIANEISRRKSIEVVHIVPPTRGRFGIKQVSGNIFEYSASIVEKLASLNSSTLASIALSHLGLTRLQRFVRKNRIDLLLIAAPHHAALRIGKTPFVLTIWDVGHRDLSFFPEFSSDLEWYSRENLFRFAAPRAFRVLVDSEATKRKLVGLYGVEETRLIVVGLLPTMPSGEHPREVEEDYLIYPAASWAHKNHVTLLRAFAVLTTRFPRLTLVITGRDSGNHVKIQELAAELGIESRVKDLGIVSRTRLAGLVDHARVLVMPSMLGPTNLPPMEAAILGVPSVVSDAHNFAPWNNSLVTTVPALNVQAWVDEITRLLELPPRKEGKGHLEFPINKIEEIIDDFSSIRNLWG